MIRKCLAVILGLLVLVGSVAADSTTVKGLFRKFKDGTVTVEFQGKPQDFKVAEKVRLNRNIITADDAFKKFKDGDLIAILVENDKVVAVAKGKK